MECVREGVRPETPAPDTYLLRVGPELWGAVVREDSSPAGDTRAALEAIRAALNAVRRLRFAGDVTEDERCRLAALAAEAVERQERVLRLWSLGRGLDTVQPAPEAAHRQRRGPWHERWGVPVINGRLFARIVMRTTTMMRVLSHAQDRNARTP